MDEQTVMMVMDTTAQTYETLVARIEALERRLEEYRVCSCQEWKEQMAKVEAAE